MATNWLDVADVIRRSHCFERQRTKQCGCKVRRKTAAPYNPCDRTEEVARMCEDLERGVGGDVHAIAKWLHGHVCTLSRRGGGCQHRTCIDREQAMAFVMACSRLVAV